MIQKKIFFIFCFTCFFYYSFSQNNRDWFPENTSKPFNEIKLDLISMFFSPSIALEYEYRANRTIGFGINTFFNLDKDYNNDLEKFFFPESFYVTPFINFHILTPYNKGNMEGFYFQVGLKLADRYSENNNFFDVGFNLNIGFKWNVSQFIFEPSFSVYRYLINPEGKTDTSEIGLAIQGKIGYRF